MYLTKTEYGIVKRKTNGTDGDWWWRAETPSLSAGWVQSPQAFTECQYEAMMEYSSFVKRENMKDCEFEIVEFCTTQRSVKFTIKPEYPATVRSPIAEDTRSAGFRPDRL